MPIKRNGAALFVDAPVAAYCIEPIRFELGLSRVEMVDQHLAELCRTHRGHGADTDELLEARALFAAGRHDFVVAAWAE
jgi:hypothetical protein